MQKRTLICFILCMVLFFVSVLRVTTVATEDYSKVQNIQNGIRFKIGNSRGTIYDCNMVRLTNCEEKILAAVSPTPRAVTAISQVLEGNELTEVLEQLKGNKPILCEVPEEINCDGIVCTRVFSDSKTPSRHIIGYTDSDLKGVSGLQKAYDQFLYQNEDISIFYTTDAKGRILEGVEPELENNNQALKIGIVTTLDINIQEIAEKYAQNLEMGAVIVSDLNGKIKASVSRPAFDSNNIELYLESGNSPLLNRAINAYNVGSVFKPCVAIAGIESGKENYNYTCVGSCEIIDRSFKCHKQSGHGNLNLDGALALSCNTYFYNFSFDIGYEKIYKTAQNLSFNQSLKLCDGIYTAKGNLPKEENLSNIAHLANFSIGQGELLLSPISMLNLYCSIAGNGSYCVPSLIEAKIENGSLTPIKENSPTKVMKPKTAEMLREYLMGVLEEGTGEKAKPKTVSAAGKTATAQTGKFRGGKEINEGWFCGFFPALDPKYVVIVFSEDDSKQSLTCAEIFANIADDVTALK